MYISAISTSMSINSKTKKTTNQQQNRKNNMKNYIYYALAIALLFAAPQILEIVNLMHENAQYSNMKNVASEKILLAATQKLEEERRKVEEEFDLGDENWYQEGSPTPDGVREIILKQQFSDAFQALKHIGFQTELMRVIGGNLPQSNLGLDGEGNSVAQRNTMLYLSRYERALRNVQSAPNLESIERILNELD